MLKPREVIDVVFEAMTEALNRGEMVCLPFGTFEVLDHPRPPQRGWFLKSVRVIYKRRKYIRFTPWFPLDEADASDAIGGRRKDGVMGHPGESKARYQMPVKAR